MSRFKDLKRYAEAMQALHVAHRSGDHRRIWAAERAMESAEKAELRSSPRLTGALFRLGEAIEEFKRAVVDAFRNWSRWPDSNQR